MNRQTLALGRIGGIPIRLDISWFLVFGLFTWTLAVGYFPDEFPNWPVFQYWIMGAIAALMLFGSVLLHKSSHSLIALHYKIPVRSITLFIFGGMAEITAEPPSAGAEFLIAIAGPLTSFALALFFRMLQIFFAGVTPLLTIHQIKKVPQSKWPVTKASQVMLYVDQLKVVQPGTGLWTALEAMDRGGVNQLPVIEDGRVIGMLTREGVNSYLGILRELDV